MGSFQFCLSGLLGIARIPKQKYFFKSCEGLLIEIIQFILRQALGQSWIELEGPVPILAALPSLVYFMKNILIVMG